MYGIDKENTALSKLGLTYDMITQQNERIEIEPVAKTTRKEKYIEYELANSIKEAYADDLEEAYHVIESLIRENAELTSDVEKYQKLDKNKAAQLKKVLDGDAAFKEAETLLAQLDQQMEAFEKAKKEDRERIQTLQTALNDARSELSMLSERAEIAANDMEELQSLRNEIPQLRDEVQSIIDDLMANLEAAGIEIDTE